MKKLKNLEQELEFLRSGSLKSVEDYISVYALKRDAEVEFVNLFSELVCLYISKHGLHQKSARAVIMSANWRNVECLLSYKAEKYNVEALFLEHGNYKQVVAWLRNHDCSKYPEKELFWNGEIAEVIEFIKKRKVSAFGQLDLLMRGVPSIAKHLILRDKLNEKNRIVAAKVVSNDNAWLLVKLSEDRKDYKVLKQIFMVRFERNLKKVIQTHLEYEAEKLFIETAPFDMVVLYAKRFRLLEIASKLLERPREDGIIKFLSKNKLSEECEHKLLDRGCHTEIKAYIKSWAFSVDAEVRFIKRGYHREIMLYLKKHSLSDEAQVWLINRGNGTEIMELLASYPLADRAVEALLLRGIKDEIDVWTANILPEAV